MVKNYFLALCGLLLLLPSLTFAQQTEETGASSQEAQYSVEIFQESVERVSKGVYKTSFSVKNKGNALTDGRFSAMLTDKAFFDSIQVLPLQESFSLALGETKTFTFSFPVWIPQPKEGESLQITIVATNAVGFSVFDVDFDIAYEDVVSEKNSDVFLYDCFFRLESQERNEEESIFLSEQGIDVSIGEDVPFVCRTSAVESSRDLYASVALYERSYTAGKKVLEKKLETPMRVTDKTNTVKIQGISSITNQPQAYDAIITLLDKEGAVATNTVRAHFVVRGVSATIQLIESDKIIYKQGESANISLLVTGPASNFPDARGGV